MRGDREHELQPAQRARRVHTARCVRLLHADRHRLPGDWIVFARQGGTTRVEGDGRLANAAATRLTGGYSAADGRRFGLTVGGAFLALGVVTRWRGHAVSAAVFLVVAALLILAAAVSPVRLRAVDRAWMAMAHAISRVTTPLFMALIYFLLLTPTGLLRRAGGRNALVHKAGQTGFWADRSKSPA